MEKKKESLELLYQLVAEFPVLANRFSTWRDLVELFGMRFARTIHAATPKQIYTFLQPAASHFWVGLGDTLPCGNRALSVSVSQWGDDMIDRMRRFLDVPRPQFFWTEEISDNTLYVNVLRKSNEELWKIQSTLHEWLRAQPQRGAKVWAPSMLSGTQYVRGTPKLAVEFPGFWKTNIGEFEMFLCRNNSKPNSYFGVHKDAILSGEGPDPWVGVSL